MFSWLCFLRVGPRPLRSHHLRFLGVLLWVFGMGMLTPHAAQALTVHITGTDSISGVVGQGASSSFSFDVPDAPVANSECTVLGTGTPGPWSGPTYSWDPPTVSDATALSASLSPDGRNTESVTLNLLFLKTGDYTVTLHGGVGFHSSCGDAAKEDTRTINVHVDTGQVIQPSSVLDALVGKADGKTWKGGSIVNTTAQGQELTQQVDPITKAVFLFKFHPTNASPCVTVTLPDWNQFLTDGWSVHFYDAAQGGNDITQLITREEGWTSPLSDHQHGSFNNTWIDPNTTIRAEVQAEYVGLMYQNRSFLVRGRTPTDALNGEDGGVAEDDVKATIYAYPGGSAVQPDLEVQQVGANSWQGAGIYAPQNDPTTVTGSSNGSTLKYLIKVTNRGTLRRQFTLKEAENADSKATIFDDAENGTDITTAFQTGYDVVLVGGESRTLRVEVIPNPQGDGGSGQIDISATDATFSDWVRINTAFSPVQPDVSLECTDEGASVENVGDGVLNDDIKETLSAAVWPGETPNFRVHIKNTGQNAASFCVKMQLPLANGAAPQPWAHQGWSAKATLDGQTQDLATQLQSDSGWRTPLVAAGGEAILNVTVSSTTDATTTSDGSFRFSAQSGTLSDAVVGQLTAQSQSIDKIQWSRDGSTWTDVVPVGASTLLQMEHNATLGLRAVKSQPDVPWGANEVLGPKWKFQGQDLEGETVWLHPNAATGPTGAMVTATLGSSVNVPVRVLPDAFVTLTMDNSQAVVSAGATQTQAINVSIQVLDAEDSPLPHLKVKLRALNSASGVASNWVAAGSTTTTQGIEQVLETDDAGEIHVSWAAQVGEDPLPPKIVLHAQVVDDTGEFFGEEDTFNITVTAAQQTP